MDELALAVILALMLVGFVIERFPVDVTALLALAGLLAFDLVTPAQAIAGFSNPATITVLMFFILSDGLTQSGVVGALGHRVVRLAGGTGERAAVLVMLVTGVLSAFVTNTATVSIMMPVMLGIARRFKKPPSKLLIPLSYAAILGGTCTLIGTSTNILVGSLASEFGLEPFTMFEFVKVGGLVFAVGIAYNLFIAPRLLAERPTLGNLTDKYEMGEYLMELHVAARSRLVGRMLVEERIGERFDVSVLEIQRGGERITQDLRSEALAVDDLLIVRGRMTEILALREEFALLLSTDVQLDDEFFEDDSNVLVEVQVLPQSDLVNANLKEIDFRKRFGCFVLALNRVARPVAHARLATIRLQAWDTLLVFGPRQRLATLAAGGSLNVVQELDVRLRLARRWWVPTATVIGVVTLSALGVVELVEGAIFGVAALVATRTLRIRKAYQAVDWSVVVLMASMIPMGTALQETGLASDVAEWLVGLGDGLGPWAVLALVLLATSVLTEAVTNVSTAVLMVPIAVSIAGALGADPKPFLMAIAFGASMSFATPTGYQTNTIVYGPGGYRFTDYVKAGLPLNLLAWVIASVVIPVVWPF